MRIACLGGGPAGLYFGISMKLRHPDADVVIFERNRPDDTFGWGVVLSDETLDNLSRNDPVSAKTIRENFAYWDDVALVHDGKRTVSGGHGFCGIGRKTLLLILQDRARDASPFFIGFEDPTHAPVFNARTTACGVAGPDSVEVDAGKQVGQGDSVGASTGAVPSGIPERLALEGEKLQLDFVSGEGVVIHLYPIPARIGIESHPIGEK